MNNQKGVTLLELLVAVMIVGILFSFALPAYQNNIDTAEDGVVRANMDSIEMFQEDFFLRTGAYANGLANIGEIEDEIGWNPRADDGITYVIAASDGTFYNLTATHPDGWSVCRRYPERQAC